tara:strand:- start:570 stop:818 length:249 start_codon:yes stop_codon:yes gene_type:complete
MGVFLGAHNKGYNMAKMREYTFRSESGQEEKTTALSFKRAVKLVQGKFEKTRQITGEWISKKNKQISEVITIPVGRKKKLNR